MPESTLSAIEEISLHSMPRHFPAGRESYSRQGAGSTSKECTNIHVSQGWAAVPAAAKLSARRFRTATTLLRGGAIATCEPPLLEFRVARKEILKLVRSCCTLTLDDDARHNTRQREETGAVPVDRRRVVERGAVARILRHGGHRAERAGRNDPAHPANVCPVSDNLVLFEGLK